MNQGRPRDETARDIEEALRRRNIASAERGKTPPPPTQTETVQVVNAEAALRRAEWLINEFGGRLAADIDAVGERVLPVGEAMGKIRDRLAQEKYVTTVMEELAVEMRHVRTRIESRAEHEAFRARLLRRNQQLRRRVWWPLAGVAAVMIVGGAFWGGAEAQRSWVIVGKTTWKEYIWNQYGEAFRECILHANKAAQTPRCEITGTTVKWLPGPAKMNR